MYVQLAGFISNLTDKLVDIDTDLPIPDNHLALLGSRLSEGDYSFLKILDGTNIEYIKLIKGNGRLRIERGAELTKPTTFPVGSCVKWELTSTAIRDIVCQMPCCP